MRKASKITLIALAILFIIGLYYYHKLGGFNEPEIKIAHASAYVVAGKPYVGKMMGQGSKEFGQLFNEADKYIEDKILTGVSVGVFYNNPRKENDTITAFVGVILKDTLQKLPNGYVYRRIPARKIVRAHIKSHMLVAPFIYPDIEEFAKLQKVELIYNPYLEMYPGDKEMIIEVPVK